jgi:hypothetical protein
MIAPPLMSLGVPPEHEIVEADDTAPFAELPANVPAVADVRTVNVPMVPDGPLGPDGPEGPLGP